MNYEQWQIGGGVRVRDARWNLFSGLLTLFIDQIYKYSAGTCLRHDLNIPAQKKGQLELAEYLLEHAQKNKTLIYLISSPPKVTLPGCR